VGDRLVLGNQNAEFIFSQEVQDQPVPSTGISITQLVPILSTGKQLGSKGFLVPGILTVAAVVSMFGSIGNFGLFRLLLGTYLGLAGFGVVYFLCGKARPWWLTPILAVPAILTCLALVVPVVQGGRLTVVQSPILSLFFHIFRDQLPGNIDRAGNNFFAQLIAHFFGAGLMEELLKALPVFLFYGIGLILPRWWRTQIGVNEPLDGILFGASSAVGFTLIETLGQYVPNIIADVIKETGQEGVGEIIGVQLLIPRVLGSVAGHIAYSGYFGYFIGLFALKPKTWWLTLPVGYLTASALHAFWNASPSIAGKNDLTTIYVVLTIVGVISYVFLVAAILKARVMSPTRSQNFSTRLIE
jgi:RsiW-degrading membrane proteinase PrsW (M82 family)